MTSNHLVGGTNLLKHDISQFHLLIKLLRIPGWSANMLIQLQMGVAGLDKRFIISG